MLAAAIFLMAASLYLVLWKRGLSEGASYTGGKQ